MPGEWLFPLHSTSLNIDEVAQSEIRTLTESFLRDLPAECTPDFPPAKAAGNRVESEVASGPAREPSVASSTVATPVVGADAMSLEEVERVMTTTLPKSDAVQWSAKEETANVAAKNEALGMCLHLEINALLVAFSIFASFSA